jgi:uncharacterized membrane protein YfcA
VTSQINPEARHFRRANGFCVSQKKAGVSATGTHNWNVLFLMILAVLVSAHDGDRWTRKSGPQKLIKFILALAVLFAFN